jgi:putative heme-binding domain-containing protein
MPIPITQGQSRWRFLACLALAAACGGAGVRPAFAADDPMSDDPEVERRLLQLPEGFDVQLYASEPAVINPVSMNFDAHGRLWVLCIPSYPHVLPGQESRDYITVLEGVGADGRAQKSHVFADGLTIPTGMIPGDGGVYVGQGDQLLHLKDTDGDGKADQRRMLLSGFGTQDMHHAINTFRWGPDGSLYFNQGCYILSSVETPHGLRRQFGGCLWRLRTDSLGLEIYDRSVFLNNTWGHVFDDWGRPMISSAWPGDINLVLPDTPLNDSNDADFVPQLAMTKLAGDRHSGMERITGRHFPPDWQGNLVTGGFQSQRVNRFAVEENGERLSARQLAPLVVSRHRKFRPVDIKMGPDGALYVADWYDLIIQHNQVDFRDARRDHERGRIWRITYKGRPLVAPPDLAGPTPLVLDWLKDPEQWTRDQARRTLAERDRSEVTAALRQWVAAQPAEAPDSEAGLLEALWTYETVDTVEPSLLRRLLRAKDGRVRAAATTVLGHWHDHLPDRLALLAAQARDEDARVRLAAVLAAQRIPAAGALEAAATALDRATDPMLDFELGKAARVLRPYWYPEFQAGRLTLDNDARRISFALIALRSADAVPKLLELLAAGKIAREHQADLLASVAATGNARQTAAVLDAAVANDALDAPDRARLLDALAEAARGRKVIPESDLARIATLADRDDALGLAAIRVAGVWRVDALAARLRRISEDAGANSQRRQAAMTAIAGIGGSESRSYLATLTGPGKPFAVRGDAVVSLAALDLTEAAGAAARLFQEPGAGDATPVFASLLRRKGGADALAGAMKDCKPHADAAKVGLRELSASGTPSPRLAEVLRSAADLAAVRRQDSPDELRRLVALATAHGDPARGERLFRSASVGCMRCHAIAGAGGNVGPDLAAIGTSAPPDILIEKILHPARHVKDGFVTLVVDTTGGDSFTGVRLRDTADAVVLRDATRDEIVIPRTTIKRQRPVGTLMPSGLADGLTDGELSDLVRFLSELGKPGPFTVGQAAVARRWWVLGTVPVSSDAVERGRTLRDDKRLVWSRQYTNVAGEVPLAEAATGPGKKAAIVRCAIDVTAGGPITIAINGADGLELWVDGVPVRPHDRVSLDLTTGRHTLDFWIDLPRRRTDSLRCELVGIGASGARAQWAGD